MASIHNKCFQDFIKDETLKWLKENDPDYGNKTKNKDMEYPYLTAKTQYTRKIREIPMSNLSQSQNDHCNRYIETNNKI